MSTGREQVHFALSGQKEGLSRAEIIAKCTAPASTVKSALGKMVTADEVVADTREGAHKTRYALAGGPVTTQRKKPRRRKAAAKKSAEGIRKVKTTRILPAITADDRLVLIQPRGPAQVYGVEDTKDIATLMLAHFEPD